MAKRHVVAKDGTNPTVSEKVTICFVIFIAIGCALPFMSRLYGLKNIYSLEKLALIGCLIFGGAYIISWLFQDNVPALNIKKMNWNSKIIALEIRSCINDNALIHNLNIAIGAGNVYKLPAVKVFVNDKQTEGFVAIENMGSNVDKLNSDNMVISLSGLLASKRLRKYTFTSSELNRAGTYFIYYFEDSTTSKRLVIKNKKLRPFVLKNHHRLRLAKDLVWNVSGSTPHLAIIGRTRSGKSWFVGEYLMPLMILQGWTVEFFSVKNDKYVDKYHGQYDPAKIIERLEYWNNVMKQRNAAIKKAGKSKYTEVPDMNDVALVVDEIINLNAALSSDKKLNSRWQAVIGKLTATGASAGIHVVAMSQYATREAFLPSTARANVSDAVIMLGLAADNATDRQYMLPGFELPHRSYETGQGIARIVSAGRKWQSPHYFETPYIK